METALIFSEIIFNLTISLAVMVVGGLLAIIAYHLISVVQELKELSGNLNSASVEVGERVNDIIDRLSDLPVLSYFLKKRHGEPPRKGRRKVNNKK